MLFKENRKKRKILTKLLRVAVVIFFVFTTISFFFGHKDYITRKKLIMLELYSESSRLDSFLQDVFANTSYILYHLNNLISDNPEKTEFVNNVLYSYSNKSEEIKEIFSLSLFSWANASGKVTANSALGIMNYDISIANRDYFKKMSQEPGKLHFDKATFGTLSGEWILPLAIGYFDDKGEFQGGTVGGLNTMRLSKLLQDKLGNDNISIMIVNEYNDVIVNTSEYTQNSDVYEFVKNEAIGFKKFNVRRFANESNLFAQYPFFTIISASSSPFTIVVLYDVLASRDELSESIISNILNIALIFILIISAYMILKKEVISPVITLSKYAEKIADSNTKISIPPQNSYEMDILARELQEITEVKQLLHDAEKEIKEHNVLLDQKVKERTFHLEEALNAKREFLNNMSHEMRTPLHGIKGYAEVLHEDYEALDNKKKIDIIGKILVTSQRLLNLVNNLLDMSKLASGKMNLEFKITDLSELVRDMIAECEPLYFNKPHLQIKFVYDKSIDSVTLLDRTRIEQVLRNLFSNAIKFTAEGTIMASIFKSRILNDDKTTAPAIGFSISDEGIGIPENEINQIFHAFTQSSRTKSFKGGTGLGLSICFEIIDAHKGKIWAENNLDKHGAKFSFLLPQKNNV